MAESSVNLDGASVNSDNEVNPEKRVNTVILKDDPGIDTPEAERFLREVFGRSRGYVEVAAFLQGSRKPVCAFRHIGEEITRADGSVLHVDPGVIASAVERGDEGITVGGKKMPVDAWYVRMTTLAAEPEGSQRGGAANVREFFGFWLDGDFDVEGHHKTDGKSNDGTVVLPPDADAVRALWTAAGYPPPTIEWMTGGGVNGLWLLENPVTIGDGPEGAEQYAIIKAASKRWHERVRMVASQEGYHHDTTHNLDRLVRLPGSVNRKVMHHPKPVTARYEGQRYTLDDLLSYIPEPVRTDDGALIDPMSGQMLQAAPERPAFPGPRTAGQSGGSPIEGLTPWDDFDARGDWWADVLGTLGFQHHSWSGQIQNLTRPGKEVTAGQSATLNHDGLDKLYLFSDSVERMYPSNRPYTGQYLTKGQALCHMVHGGDWAALARDLRSRGYGDPLPYNPHAVPLAPEDIELFAGQTDENGQVTVPVAQESAPIGTGATPAPVGMPKAPIPLEEPPPKAYDLSKMGSLGTYTQAVADSIAVPGGMVLMTQLGVISAAVGGRRSVQVRPGWSEPVVTHTLALAPPGSRKSAAVTAATKPLKSEEKKRRETESTQVQVDKMRRQILDDQIKAAAARAAKGEHQNVRAAAEAEAEGLVVRRAAMGEPMQETRLLTSDITPEELAYLMARQGGRMAVIDSEAAFLSNISGRYSPGGRPKVDLVLNAYDQQSYTVDRVGREEPVEIDAANLTVALAVQGDAITGLGKSCTEMDRRGTWGRYLYDVTPGSVLRTVDTPEIPSDMTAVHNSRISELMGVCYSSSDSEVMTLSEDARTVFFAYYLDSDPALRGAHHRVRIQGWEEKQPGRIIRIAALRTLYEDPHAQVIPGSIMRDVIALDETMRQHAHKASAYMQLTDNDPIEPARDVLGWLLEELPTGMVRIKDVLRAMRKRRRPWAGRLDDASGAVDVLEEYGHIHFFRRPDGSLDTGAFSVSRYHVPDVTPEQIINGAPAEATSAAVAALDEDEQYAFESDEETRLRLEVRHVAAFASEHCHMGDVHQHKVRTDALFEAYLLYRGKELTYLTPSFFGKALARALPQVIKKRVRFEGKLAQGYAGIELLT